jgi:hypothetical protein
MLIAGFIVLSGAAGIGVCIGIRLAKLLRYDPPDYSDGWFKEQVWDP